jgi:hypothetical protein
MWKSMVEPDRRFRCWIVKATDWHPEYVILITFLRQDWLRDRASVLHYTYFACLVSVLTRRYRMSCFIVWTFPVKVWVGNPVRWVFCQIIQGNFGIVPSVTPRLIPSTSYLIHSTLVIQPFCASLSCRKLRELNDCWKSGCDNSDTPDVGWCAGLTTWPQWWSGGQKTQFS